MESIFPQVLVLRCIPIMRQFSMDTVFAESLGFCYFDYFSGTARCRPHR